MPTNFRQGNRIAKSARYEDAAGIRIDTGMHVGVITDATSATRTGRLTVYIPALGGSPDDSSNLYHVAYASPFFGYTNHQSTPGSNSVNTRNEFDSTRHTYGMWMTPPDIGVSVLVQFAGGDPNNGFWFAVVPPTAEHTMAGTSGGVSASDLDKDAQVDSLIKGYKAKYAPAVEYNSAKVGSQGAGVHTNKKPPHRIQTKILAEQGTLGDPVRGIDAANAIRETPSGVFGITTPGRTYVDQVTDDWLQRVSPSPQADRTKLRAKVDNGRKGGHQFTMDDGDVDGNHRRVKIRSAAGHQIIMDDTEGMIYISNSTGKTWIELTNDGQIYLYAESDISIRTSGNLSTKVDGDYSLEVDGDYNLNVKGKIKTESTTQEEITKGAKSELITGALHQTIEGGNAVDVTGDWGVKISGAGSIDSASASGWKAGGNLSLQGTNVLLNSGAPPAPLAATGPDPFVLAELFDTIQEGDIWKHEASSPMTAETILAKIPTHEPYDSRTVEPLVSKTGKPSKKV